MQVDADEEATMRQLEAGEKGKDKSWHELHAVEVVAANSLGYDSFSWDRGEAPWPCQQPWESLTREQFYAADVRYDAHTRTHARTHIRRLSRLLTHAIRHAFVPCAGTWIRQAILEQRATDHDLNVACCSLPSGKQIAEGRDAVPGV